MPRLDSERDVCGHDRAGHVRHPGRHHGHELGARHARQEGANRQRGFGLPHEDRGCDVEALRTARAHDLVHHHGKCLHDDLHDAEVVHDGEERGNEDDRRHDL